MRSLWVIAIREYIAAVFTKAFLFGMLFAPAMVGVTILFTSFIADVEEEGERHLAIIDLTGQVAPALREVVERNNADENEKLKFYLETVGANPLPDEPDLAWQRLEDIKEAQAARVRNSEIFGFLIVGPELLDLDRPDEVYQEPDAADEQVHRNWQNLVARYSVAYGSESLTDVKVRKFLSRNLNSIVQQQRYLATGIDSEIVSKVNRSVKIEEFKVTKQRPSSEGDPAKEPSLVRADSDQELVIPLGFMGLLMLAIMTSAGPMLNNTIEEKSNRVMEVLLASASPFQILVGKIVGNALMGITVASIWGGAALTAAAYHELLPSDGIGAGLWLSVIMFFLTGYLIYGLLYGAVGSICMTIQEAQNFMAPMFLLIFLPMVAVGHVIENPGSPVSVGLSMFPFSAPFIMMLRLGLTPAPPVWQIVLSMGLMVLGVAVTMWVSAKVFRIAILLYGKPPSFRQLYRWVFARQ